MSLWQDPDSRERRKPLAECPLFESGLSGRGDVAPLSKVSRDAQCETGVQHIKAGSPPAAPEFAHARRADPEHSHSAARSVCNLGRTRDAILAILKSQGPLTDEGIAFWFAHLPGVDSSPSGLRSRRSELVKLGFVVEGGTGKTASGRACTIWRLK